MKQVVYSGILIVGLTALTMPAIAKGKPQKLHPTQTTEQTSEDAGVAPRKHPQARMCQGLVGLPQLPSTTQQQTTQQTTIQQQVVQGAIAQQQTNVTSTSVSQVRETNFEIESDEPFISGDQPNLRSNRGGQLRGQARAQQVRAMKGAKDKKIKGKPIEQTCGQMTNTDSIQSGKGKHSLQSDRSTNH